jgi:hypothetical protein
MCNTDYQLVNSKCQRRVAPTFISKNYYVIGDLSIIKPDGSSPSKGFYFLQQAINSIIIDSSNTNINLNANIYIGTGNPNNTIFFFYCNPGYDYIFFLSQAQNLTNYCNSTNSSQIYGINDNISITI